MKFAAVLGTLCMLFAGQCLADDLADGIKFEEHGEPAKAVRLYEHAALNGSVEAKTRLGTLYLTGQGVPKDDKRAAMWFEQAAEAGDIMSASIMATMYESGSGVAKDDKRALYWTLKAADAGEPGPQFQAGWKYYNGQGTPKDRVEAAKWWTIWDNAAKKFVAAHGSSGFVPRLPEDVKSIMRGLSPKELAEAQSRAADWAKSHPAKQK